MPIPQILSAIMALNLECAETDAKLQALDQPRDMAARTPLLVRLEICNRHLQALQLAYRELKVLRDGE